MLGSRAGRPKSESKNERAYEKSRSRTKSRERKGERGGEEEEEEEEEEDEEERDGGEERGRAFYDSHVRAVAGHPSGAPRHLGQPTRTLTGQQRPVYNGFAENGRGAAGRLEHEGQWVGKREREVSASARERI